CGPLPLSMVKATPETVLPETRFVTGTVRFTDRDPLTVPPGLPPEHDKTMSPTRSVRPSARTTGGLENVEQLKEACPKAKFNKPLEKNRESSGYNRRDISKFCKGVYQSSFLLYIR